MSVAADSGSILSGRRVALAGKFAGMNQREAQQLIRQHGGTVASRCDTKADVIVVGEADLPLVDAGDAEGLFDDDVARAAEQGRLEIISETTLWQRLGLVENERRSYLELLLGS